MPQLVRSEFQEQVPLAMPLLLAQYAGFNGFLGTRGSFMLDLVFLAMFAVVPVMGWSIYLVKYRRRYQTHKRIQLVLGAVLLVAVAAFEIDMRIHGWTDRAEPSRYWQDGRWNDWIDYSLAIHLAFAIPSLFLWLWVIVQGLRRFPRPPAPCPYSRQHRLLGRLAAITMVCTSLTGWLFYWFAFAA